MDNDKTTTVTITGGATTARTMEAAVQRRTNSSIGRREARVREKKKKEKRF